MALFFAAVVVILVIAVHYGLYILWMSRLNQQPRPQEIPTSTLP
jgi:hypothetical protein